MADVIPHSQIKIAAMQTDPEPHFAGRKSLPARSLSLEAFGPTR